MPGAGRRLLAPVMAWRATGAVGEANLRAVEPVDGGFHGDPSGFQRADEAVIDRDRDAVGGGRLHGLC